MSEYIIVGDTDKYEECLVYTCGKNKENAEKALNKLLHNPDATDEHFRKDHRNFRILEVSDESCWWNDPFLAN